jgi:hypothetical protein
MVKRAPVNVRYLWLFGEHILTRSFTARDPKLPIVIGCWFRSHRLDTFSSFLSIPSSDIL